MWGGQIMVTDLKFKFVPGFGHVWDSLPCGHVAQSKLKLSLCLCGSLFAFIAYIQCSVYVSAYMT